MENANHNIDEIFRQRLYEAEVPPPPFVWPAVEKELRKRRRLWVLWVFAFGTLSACVWLWQAQFGHDDATTLGSFFVQTVDSPKIAQETSTARPQELPEQISEGDHSKVTKRPVQHPAEFALAQLTPKGAASSDALEQIKKEGNLSENSFRRVTSDNSEAEKTNGQPVAAAPDQVILENAEPLAAPLMHDFAMVSGNQPRVVLQSLAIEPPQQVASILLAQETYSPKKLKSFSRRKKPQPKFCYDFARHPSAWLVDAYIGPSLAQRTLTSRLEDQPYLNQRLATERRSVAMNAGVRASLMFNRNFLVRTGLHYDQMTEVFEFIDPTSVTYILKFNTGDPIPDTLGVQYGENYLKTYNRYAMLDIPLMVGVEMRHGRSGFSINAGISANVLFKKSGVIIDPVTHEPARFGPLSDKNLGPKLPLSQEVFRANVGLSATASIQWYWHLTPYFRVFAEPSFRQLLRPVSVASHPVEHRYSILGLRLGATKIF